MRKIFSIGVLIASTMLVIALCGCSENYKRYKEAKERMSGGNDDASIAISRSFRQKDSPLPESIHDIRLRLRKEESYFEYRYYEWAAELFDELGDYKDSKELAKEARYHAAVYFYERYDKNDSNRASGEYYLKRAYQLLLKAGEYKDASDKAAEYSAIMLKNALDFNEKRKPHEEPAKIEGLFLSLDEQSRKKNADLIYQRAISYFEKDPNFPVDESEYRGRSYSTFDAEHGKLLHYLDIVKYYITMTDSVKEKLRNIAMIDVEKLIEKRNEDDFHNIHASDYYYLYKIVNILKDDTVLKEKLYCFVHDNIDNPIFWDNFYQMTGFSDERKRKLHTFIFQQIRNYKDTTDWYRRLIYANDIPTIDEDSYKNGTSRIGINPQPRTVVATDERYNKSLKQEMKGNIFFTDDIEKACAVIHSETNHYLWKTFNYAGGDPVKYYNTTITVKVYAVGGKVLYNKSLSAKFSQPYERVSQGITKEYAYPKGDINIAELAKVLEKEFVKFE